MAIAATVIGINMLAPNKQGGLQTPSLTEEDDLEIEESRERLIRILGILGEIKLEESYADKPEDHTVDELLQFENGKVDRIGTIRDCIEQTGTFTCAGSDESLRCTFKNPSDGTRSVGVHWFAWVINEVSISGIEEEPIKYDVEEDLTDDDHVNTLEMACRDAVTSLLSEPAKNETICDRASGDCRNPGLLEAELSKAGRQIEIETERIGNTLADYGYEVTEIGSNLLEIRSDEGSIQFHGSPIIDRTYEDEERLTGASPVGAISFMGNCRQGNSEELIEELETLTQDVGGFSYFYGSGGCYGESR